MSSKLSFWLDNARPISLPQSLLPALTAVALSYGAAQFSWIAALASIVGVVFLHFALNLLDDWFDYKVGSAEARVKVANEGFRGRMVKYPYLTSGQATHNELLKAIAGFLNVAPYLIVVVAVILGKMQPAYLAVLLVLPVSLWLLMHLCIIVRCHLNRRNGWARWGIGINIRKLELTGSFSCTITTNAQLPFAGSKADSIWVSLDGVNGCHEEVRGKGTFAKLEKNIAECGLCMS